MYRYNCFFLAACLLLGSSPVSAIWPFPPKRFTGNSLLEAGSLGIGKDERIIAFGDFNGDQFLDILALGADQQTLQVYLWSHESFYYQRSASFRHPRTVYNVVPGDFTHSGKLDLLVMGKGSDTSQLDMVVYAGLLGGSFDVNNPLAVPSSTLSQPIVVDVNGDMKMDLLGVTPSSRGSSNSLRVWQNTWNSSSPNPRLFDVVEPKLKGTQCTISHPHSNAVVDLNGDCLADIFLVCDDSRGGKSFQVWVNNKEDGFSLAQTGYLPAGTQSITFADMDRDGTLDMVFTTCSHVSQATGVGRDCSLNIAYNKQLPLCAKSTVSKSAARCRQPDELCVADPDFKFDLTESSDNNDFVRMPISKLFDSSSSLLVLDTSFDPPVPLPIRLGDANLDGFPDLLQVIITRDHQTPKLLLSVPCSSGLVGCPENGQGRRSFSVVKKGTESLEAITDAISASFLDMDEDGTLDMMIQRKGSGGGPKVVFVQNNVYYDAFFLKAIVLNGACENGWCYSPNRTIKYHPFGVSYAGATYKYTVLDTSGRRSAAQVGQLSQSSYHSLMTPYSYFGLGRTNNYIENLFVGSTIHSKQHFINMEGVIPNSKVVILPPPHEGDAWKRELFLRPGAWIPWVTITVVVGMGLLAVIVFVLHMNEKREDELERRRASHRINFDAL